MRIGSLFSGAGGLDMAVEAVFGGKIVWHSEIDPAASKVLAHHWPDVPNLGDISEIDWSVVEPVDVLCGGFPCQDLSVAGKRAGLKEETRSGLWLEYARAIDHLRPKCIVIENVRGILSAKAHRAMEPGDATLGDGSGGPVLRAIGAVVGDLADRGYVGWYTTLAASDVGAPHRRERVFILARRADVDGWHGGSGGSDVAILTAGGLGLLPTPRTTDSHGAGHHGRGGPDLRTEITLLCTPSTADGNGGHLTRSGDRRNEPLLPGQAREMATSWSKYEPAIRRWEQALSRPAPSPTEPNRNGNPRLSAAFSEWLMGWPAGWVTDPQIGISRNDQLRIIGNGVVPQQAIAALNRLLEIAEVNA